MKAYIMTANGVHVVEGACSLEVHEDEIVLVRSSDPERRVVAAAKLADRLWVAIGEQPPATRPRAGSLPDETPAPPVPVGNGGWPPEPPPDVDSEG
jgi:hypothetical protein